MNFVFSKHARDRHSDEKWNAATILDLIIERQLQDRQDLPGQTANVICGVAPDGEYVGIVTSKPKFNTCVVVTGFAASKEYWESV